MFQKELYDGMSNVTVCGAILKRLNLKAYKVSIVQHLGPWIVCTPLSVNGFVSLATQQHFKYHCEALFKTPCITSGSHIDPKLSQVKLGAFCYIMTVQNTVHVL
jgi:hypothetical protein